MKPIPSAKRRALATALAQAREAAGLTQRQLAARLKRPATFIWKIEAGTRRLDVLEFVEIARALGVDPPELLRRALR